MKVILPVVYLGNIEYYSLLKNAEEVFFDLHGHYLKQNFRNRTEIYGANGKLDLIIPVVKHPNHTALGDIKISYDHAWQRHQWKSIACRDSIIKYRYLLIVIDWIFVVSNVYATG